MNCSLFLKNLEKTFLQFDLQKKTLSNTLKFYRNIYRKNLSIIDIALRNSDLSIIGIAQGFFEIIAYRYRFSTERFIEPISGHGRKQTCKKFSGKHVPGPPWSRF